MNDRTLPASNAIAHDLLAGLVVFLVALPLCLGISLASHAPMMSGIVAGIIGGLLVGMLSGSQSSVSGPAAGLTAIVATQIDVLGFQAFLVAVALAGLCQVALGLFKAGSIASFIPSSVIKGLLAAIGLLLILKQIPHVLGDDQDPVGDMGFSQADGMNTFSEILEGLQKLHPGAALIGLASIALLLGWDKIGVLKKSPVPAPLVAVVFGVGVNLFFASLGEQWLVGPSHLVQLPVAESANAALGLLSFPDFTQLKNPAIYLAAGTIALVASLETLINLEAVDRLDPLQRQSPPNRELMAQGAGNLLAGLIGGLPMTSVIVRSSANINAGAKTKLSAVFHGVLLIASVLLIPTIINRIPLSSLAAILIVTGMKLASPALFKKMWNAGKDQFFPFILTVVPIVLLDLLTGVLIGLGVSIAFILRSNFRSPLRRVVEHHITGDVLRIQLANQVSFFNRAALEKTLDEVPRGGRVLLDARGTDYIDADILDMLEVFRTQAAPAHQIELSFVGFKDSYALEDSIQYVDYTNRELQDQLTPAEVLTILRDGNRRFVSGQRIERDLLRQMRATAPGQAPLAVVLACIDSRTPAEMIFDLGIGDIFSVRVAGNVARDDVLGSIEYGCAVAGAKLVVVVGHTSCGAVGAAVDFFEQKQKASVVTGCQNLDSVVEEIQLSIDAQRFASLQGDDASRHRFVDGVARLNVLRTIERTLQGSSTLLQLVQDGKLQIAGALYDVASGLVEFFDSQGLTYQPSLFVKPFAGQPDSPPPIENTPALERRHE